jgi:hypothetical protein
VVFAGGEKFRQVSSGLAEGESIVVSGQHLLKPNSRFRQENVAGE